MLHATFLEHSGFLVESESALLLFDWWKGSLPPLPEKPLLVFVSHAHDDHFSPEVFSLAKEHPDVRFVLSADISAPVACTCPVFSAGGSETLSPLEGVAVETLPSTDEGVAFLVTLDGRTLFHAGDLNWWHWEGEDPAWNRSMEADFKRYCLPLENREIFLAMLPLDPRLGKDGFRGPDWFLSHARIRHFLPMHQWGDFAFTEAFLAAYPQYRDVTVPVCRIGESFSF